MLTNEEILALQELRIFPVVVDCSKSEEEYVRRIHPLMQSAVLKLLRADFLQGVSVTIFGSSLTMECDSFSDLDFSIETEEFDLDLFYELQRKSAILIEVPCDIIYLNSLSVDEKLYTEITNGLVLRRCN